MTTQNVINDLGIITRIPNKSLKELTDRLILCIGSAVSDAKTNGETCTVLDIGIGTLAFNIADGNCKFVPSKQLKSTIKSCINDKIDPLEHMLEEACSNKLLKLIAETL